MTSKYRKLFEEFLAIAEEAASRAAVKGGETRDLTEAEIERACKAGAKVIHKIVVEQSKDILDEIEEADFAEDDEFGGSHHGNGDDIMSDLEGDDAADEIEDDASELDAEDAYGKDQIDTTEFGDDDEDAEGGDLGLDGDLGMDDDFGDVPGDELGGDELGGQEDETMGGLDHQFGESDDPADDVVEEDDEFSLGVDHGDEGAEGDVGDEHGEAEGGQKEGHDGELSDEDFFDLKAQLSDLIGGDDGEEPSDENPDPDQDGDDDTSVQGDSDHDFNPPESQNDDGDGGDEDEAHDDHEIEDENSMADGFGKHKNPHLGVKPRA